jgi:prepilin-type N-terminal cleavage/methylation domain-containing protein
MLFYDRSNGHHIVENQGGNLTLSFGRSDEAKILAAVRVVLPNQCGGFMLIELLVVMAIIAVLVGHRCRQFGRYGPRLHTFDAATSSSCSLYPLTTTTERKRTFL